MSLSVKINRIDSDQYIAYIVLNDCVWKPIQAIIGIDSGQVARLAFDVIDTIKGKHNIYE